MVDNCFAVAALCIGGALLSLILKQYCSEHSMTAAIAVSAAVLTAFIIMLDEPIAEIRVIFQSAGISADYISLIFKALGICCITHITAELCRDSGEGAMASAAELWGRGAITVLSLPVLKAFLQLIEKLV